MLRFRNATGIDPQAKCADVTHQAAIRTGIGLGLFKALANGSGEPIQTSELARATGADTQLLGRWTLNRTPISDGHKSRFLC